MPTVHNISPQPSTDFSTSAEVSSDISNKERNEPKTESPPTTGGSPEEKRMTAERQRDNVIAAIPALRDFNQQRTSGVAHRYIKGTHTDTYLQNEWQRSTERVTESVQPTVTQLAYQLDKLKSKKGIVASIHGNILEKINATKEDDFKYRSDDVFKDLMETATEAENAGKPVSRQYPMAVFTNTRGRFMKFEGTNAQESHIETFIVTPHRAALQVGPFRRSRFLLDEELVKMRSSPDIEDSSPGIKLYSADLSAFIHSTEYETFTPQGLFFRRPRGSIYRDTESFLSPQSEALDGACGTLGNLWIKGLSEDDGKMLSYTLLVDMPGQGKGFFLPPPVCLRYSDSGLYFKIANAMMEPNPLADVEHKGQIHKVTTILGLMSLEMRVKRASDGKVIRTEEQLKDISNAWRSYMLPEWEWREAREIDGRSHALRSKTVKQAAIKA